MTRTISAEGPAMLRFPSGESVSVDARVTLNRSFLSVSGEGEFATDSDTAASAFLCDEPLSLTFNGMETTDIIVHEAKSGGSSARCRFRVHS